MARSNNWQDDPLWYKDAIIYQLHVKAYYDCNDDGIGDFKGLIQKLDYIKDLGVNTLWLLPFYPSPMRDDGYDIADYRNIYSDYGTRRDFRQFMNEAHGRGLRVVTELVINHTSDQHPWFQAARKAPKGSRKREFYVWSDDSSKFADTRIIFTDTEKSNWTWDDEAGAYFWHRFFSHQPDLNHNNPEVVKAVIRVMRFWLDMGVDGLRLDAIPYLCVREGTTNENLPETHAVLKEMRKVVDEHYEGRVFLAEANQWPEDAQEYFGDGDECHMAYHFPLMPRIYMAVAQEDRHPIVEIMQQTPEIPALCQWAIFLRNHDELTLEMVTDRERDYMYDRYATDLRMRVNVGIRRRLAPLMENDPHKIQLMNSLLMSMPGSPIIYYGDEIGMGDNFFLGDRNGVRTPMQWSPDRNGGFSRADPQFMYLPPIMDPVYGYEAVNVEAQQRDASSLLNWMKRLIAVRKAHLAFGRGSLDFLRPGNRKILAYVREYGDESILCVANLSRSAQPVELDLSRYKGRVPLEMLGRTPFPPIGELPYLLTLPGHGFYWFFLATEVPAPQWHEQSLLNQELPVLVLFDSWRSFFPELVDASREGAAGRLRQDLERKVLPGFLQAQRWFAAKGEALERVEVADLGLWSHGGDNWLWLRVRVHFSGGGGQEYSLPLAIAWGEPDEEHMRARMPLALAKVRQQARVGILYDALADASFFLGAVNAIREGTSVPLGKGVLAASATSAFEVLAQDMGGDVSRPNSEGTNSALVLDESLFLKVYRQAREGVNPEVEMGRFLTEQGFEHISPVAGALEYRAEDTPTTLALLQGYVANQGDGWSYTRSYLERFFENALTRAQALALGTGDLHAEYCALMHKLGLRSGELHKALAQAPASDAGFAPEAIEADEPRAWAEQVRADVSASLDGLAQCLDSLEEPERTEAGQLLARRADLLDLAAALAPASVDAVKTRYHGDYHLGQVLLTEFDFIIIDFEGEPARPLEERRARHSPLRDVAGMLRSFNYAGMSALDYYTAMRPDDRERLLPFLAEWERLAVDSFMAGYREGVADSPAWPRDEQAAQSLIQLFVLEKALYELRYELGHRPDWVGIPLRGLLGLVN